MNHVRIIPPSAAESRTHQAGRERSKWLLYRTEEGDLYFYDSVRGKAQWERPHFYKNNIAVNDPEGWLCYEVEGARFYVNQFTGEKTCFQREECKQLVPVNSAASWIGYRTRNDEVFYFNKQTKETTWRRPGYVSPNNENVEIKLAYNKHYAPEASSSLPPSEKMTDVESGPNTGQRTDGDAIGEEGESKVVQEPDQPLHTSEADPALTKQHDDEFKEMLRTFGDLKPYSLFSKWYPMFSKDKRCIAVPPNRRSALFHDYCSQLSTQLKQTTDLPHVDIEKLDDLKRVKLARKLLASLSKVDEIAALKGKFKASQFQSLKTELVESNISEAPEMSLLKNILAYYETSNKAKLIKKILKPWFT